MTPSEALILLRYLHPNEDDSAGKAVKCLSGLVNKPARGAWWKDPTRRQSATESMRRAQSRKRVLVATWRSSGAVLRTSDYGECAKIVGKTVATLRKYLSTGFGRASFVVSDDVIEVVRHKVSGSSDIG